RLLASPSRPDKVEFDIIFSCYTFDLPARLLNHQQYGFSADERRTLAEELRTLTNRVVQGDRGLWREDIHEVALLDERLSAIEESSLDRISKIYWLLDDCTRYGTLPFAGLARAGFIAVQLLRSLVAKRILTESEYNAFLAGLDT